MSLQAEARLQRCSADVPHLVALLGDKVVGVAWLAHELKGAEVKAGEDGVPLAAWLALGLPTAHRCDMADCTCMASQISARVQVLSPTSNKTGHESGTQI